MYLMQLAVWPQLFPSSDAFADNLVVKRVGPTMHGQPERGGILLGTGEKHSVLVEIVEIEANCTNTREQIQECSFFNNLDGYEVMAVKPGYSDALFHSPKR